MKRLLSILLLSLLSAIGGQAEQLRLLSQQKAKETVDYLQSNDISQLLIYNACEKGSTPQLIDVAQINYEKAGIRDYYHLTATQKSGEVTDLDLAYVFVGKDKSRKDYKCLGKTMNLNCYPCIEDGFKLTRSGKIKTDKE